MPLPPFDMSSGLMPAFIGTDATTADRSPYIVTMPELVGRFATSPERRNLLRNLLDYRDLLMTGGYTDGIQFVDGSFVENVEVIRQRPPDDIDVYSLLGIPAKFKASPPLWMSDTGGYAFWRDEIVDRDKNKARFRLDTYGDTIDTLSAPTFITQIIYWYSLFSHQRDTFAWKGFAAIPLDLVGDAAALSELDRLDKPAGGP